MRDLDGGPNVVQLSQACYEVQNNTLENLAGIIGGRSRSACKTYEHCGAKDAKPVALSNPVPVIGQHKGV